MESPFAARYQVSSVAHSFFLVCSQVLLGKHTKALSMGHLIGFAELLSMLLLRLDFFFFQSAQNYEAAILQAAGKLPNVIRFYEPDEENGWMR